MMNSYLAAKDKDRAGNCSGNLALVGALCSAAESTGRVSAGAASSRTGLHNLRKNVAVCGQFVC